MKLLKNEIETIKYYFMNNINNIYKLYQLINNKPEGFISSNNDFNNEIIMNKKEKIAVKEEKI